ncbi:hypothetical protein BC835DRAFT_1405107 [Cytidiella melzeri]|nr:hypothetical protein BC835DRAFT_1405107 [Cytidiella melzeri]
MSTSPRASASPAPGAGPRHALSAVEKQRAQLDRLLKNPEKPAFVPPPPKEKSVRPAREMMKNVQGSSAGAGSGEFHVYKASRRREYERLKLMEDEAAKEALEAEFEAKKREREAKADAKTAKNRAKRLKQKKRALTAKQDGGESSARDGTIEVPLKKRRLVNGQELLFKRPAEEEGDEDDVDEDEVGPMPTTREEGLSSLPDVHTAAVIEVSRIIIHEDD